MDSNSPTGVAGAALSTANSSAPDVRRELTSPPSQVDVFRPLTELAPNRDDAIKVLVCRKWDARNPTGKYLGTEFVLSDDQGNGVHCVARSAIAHCVAPKLEIGNVYSLRRFTVAPNKLAYRLRQGDPHLLQLEGNTVVRKLDYSRGGFMRHLFNITSIEDIAFNGNAHLIDVIGSVFDLGELKETRNGVFYLDFYLMNERRNTIKTTVWGSLAEQLSKRRDDPAASYVILLPAMNVRDYKGVTQLSSTSGTAIYDSLDIPEVFNLTQLLLNQAAPIQDIHRTLLQLLEMGREQFEVNNVASTTVRCLATVVAIHPRSTWYYNSCGERGCKKGLTPVGPQLWCESCEKACEFPLLRFRLRLVVSDETATVVVTLFDETAAALVKKDVSAVLESFGEGDEGAEYPPEILQLVGSKHLLELKSHTYYNHGQYESFTVTRVIPVPETQTAALVVAGANATDHVGKTALGGRKETLGAGGTDSAGKAVLVGTGELSHAGEEHEYLGTTVKMPANKDASCSNPTPEKKTLKRKAASPLSQSE